MKSCLLALTLSLAVALVAVVASTGCDRSTALPLGTRADRIADCREASRILAKEMADRFAPQFIRLFHYENHFNAQNGRCYLNFTLESDLGARDWALFDVDDHRELASCRSLPGATSMTCSGAATPKQGLPEIGVTEYRAIQKRLLELE
jgi:hypothetical protein